MTLTPKQKASELLEKFAPFAAGQHDEMDVDKFAEWEENTKQCAKIAVNEMINDCDASSPFETTRLAYWNEVLTHLNT